MSVISREIAIFILSFFFLQNCFDYEIIRFKNSPFNFRLNVFHAATSDVTALLLSVKSGVPTSKKVMR